MVRINLKGDKIGTQHAKYTYVVAHKKTKEEGWIFLGNKSERFEIERAIYRDRYLFSFSICKV